MEKVHLALETVGLTAEKTKLEQDCREGATELKTMDVSDRHSYFRRFRPSRGRTDQIQDCHINIHPAGEDHSYISYL